MYCFVNQTHFKSIIEVHFSIQVQQILDIHNRINITMKQSDELRYEIKNNVGVSIAAEMSGTFCSLQISDPIK